MKDSHFPAEDPSDSVPIPEISSPVLDALFAAINAAAKVEPTADFSPAACIAIEDQVTAQTYILQFIEDYDGDVDCFYLYLPDEGLRYISSYYHTGNYDNVMGAYLNNMLCVEIAPARSPQVETTDRQRKKDHLPKPSKLQRHRTPILRALRPGEAASHIEENEAILLTRVLQAIPSLSKQQDDIFELFNEDKTMPAISIDAAGKITQIKAVPFPDPGPASLPDASLDDLTREKLSVLSVKKKTTWECGAVFLERLIPVDQRACHAVLSLCADLQSGKMSDDIIASAKEDRHLQILDSVMNLAFSVGFLPAKIRTNHPVAFNALRELTKSHGIKVEIIEDLSSRMQSLFTPRVLALRSEEAAPPEELDLPSPAELANALKEKLGTDELPDDLMQAMAAMLGGNAPSPQSLGHTSSETTGIPDGEIPSYTPPSSAESYVFRVDLMDTKPPIWRRISLPTDATFFDLHRVLQAAFGWSGYHLHSFWIEGVIGYDILSWRGDASDYPSSFRQESAEIHSTLADVFSDPNGKIYYNYDFGDDWRHRIKLEKTIPTPAHDSSDPDSIFGILKGKGNILDDCGGAWGLAEVIMGSHPLCHDIDPDRLQNIQSGAFNPENIYYTSVVEEMDRQDHLNQ